MYHRTLSILVIVSTLVVTIIFLSLDSARGFYYIFWLGCSYKIWKHRDSLRKLFLKSPFWKSATFIGLGIGMIFIEETFAGVSVHLLWSESIIELIKKIPPYYANNLLTLPGYIIGWYMLLSRYRYTQREFFFLVGCFGIFAEKTFNYTFSLPIIGIPLLVVNFFTYIGIILPSYIFLGNPGKHILHPIIRSPLGFLFPILISVPLIFIHTYLAELGYIDPSILSQ